MKTSDADRERDYKAGWDAYKQLNARERSPRSHVLDCDPKRAYAKGLEKLLKQEPQKQ